MRNVKLLTIGLLLGTVLAHPVYAQDSSDSAFEPTPSAGQSITDRPVAPATDVGSDRALTAQSAQTRGSATQAIKKAKAKIGAAKTKVSQSSKTSLTATKAAAKKQTAKTVTVKKVTSKSGSSKK